MLQVIETKQLLTPENFCYWLQGFFEILEASDDSNAHVPIELTLQQVDMIRKHLGYVFDHVQVINPPVKQEVIPTDFVLPIKMPDWLGSEIHQTSFDPSRTATFC